MSRFFNGGLAKDAKYKTGLISVVAVLCFVDACDMQV